MIGSKTVGALAFLAIALGVAAASGVLAPSHWSGMSAEACLIVGVFAGLAAPLALHGWRPNEPSRTGVPPRLDQAPWDLPPLAQRAVFLTVFVALGLVAFGNREARLLVSTPERLTAAGAEYCPEPGDEPPVAPKPKPKPVVDARGCALIKRAYDLGYAKDLGACAPKELEAPEEERVVAPVCVKRQRDEPFWHWTWRQFDRNSGDLDIDPIASVSEQIDELEVRLGYLETAFAQQAHAINADPRASHHLFTNLPAPEGDSWLGALVSPTPCDTRYRGLPARPASDQPSAVFEHAFARLLFDRSLGTPTGFCHDFTLHWDSSPDACQKLIADPSGFLDSADAIDGVHAVLDRRERQREQRALARDLGRDTAIAKPPPARAIVSFQCYVVAEGPRATMSEQVRIDGVDLVVRELRVPTTGGLAAYRDLFQLLVGDGYSGASGERAVTGAETPPGPDDVLDDELRLLRLELLRDTDPFLGADWAAARAELRDTYPLHMHLHNFADVFRNRYRRERGRL